jgi:carbamoyl-phosphate synthase large subunit
VLVCGIAGASLGTEIIKSLLKAERYAVYGCDISPIAYGHWMEGIDKTYTVLSKNYASNVLEIAHNEGIRLIVPGGDAPAVLLGKEVQRFTQKGMTVVGNNAFVVETCSDKKKCSDFLESNGFDSPKTYDAENLNAVDFKPCIVKPSVDSGGSTFVFLVKDKHDAGIYVNYLRENGKVPLIQEYLPLDGGGEFTVGVLSLPNGSVYGSIAIKRVFYNKLSVSLKSDLGLISSGYTQGYVDDFLDIRKQSEEIARKLGSTGPLNIQGRVQNGKFVPFEINPRFSASTFLRTLAGFNEVDIYLQAVCGGPLEPMPSLKHGCYLRSFTETYCRPESEVCT